VVKKFKNQLEVIAVLYGYGETRVKPEELIIDPDPSKMKNFEIGSDSELW
jgi:hypothetical protein